jgi:hypothetical protein
MLQQCKVLHYHAAQMIEKAKLGAYWQLYAIPGCSACPALLLAAY